MLKTLGFGDNTILMLVVVEAALLCLIAAIGLAIAATVFKAYLVR